ncbi:hypothetical protein ADK43_30710 [Streptomyces rimosus subsp. rimosus]|nr:hypothetical protein ADK43_30710 [Streptomyces rimosus subsp. rimosus]
MVAGGAAMEQPSRYAVRTSSVLSAVTAGRRLPLLPLASAARSPSYVRSRWSSPAAARVCTMNLTVDSSSPVRRRADSEVRRGERAVIDAQRAAVAVEDVEQVEDVAGAA